MTEWSGLFLGIIAGATLVMALIQIGAVVVALRVAKQTQGMLATVRRDVQPLLAKAREMGDEASRTLSLATAQAEKVDRLVTDLTRRVEETSQVVQQAIVTPAREGLAVFAAVKAALGVLRGYHDFRGRTGRHADEDDALFIG